MMPLQVWPPHWPFSFHQHSIDFSKSHMAKVNIVQTGKYIPPSPVASTAKSHGKRHGCAIIIQRGHGKLSAMLQSTSEV